MHRTGIIIITVTMVLLGRIHVQAATPPAFDDRDALIALNSELSTKYQTLMKMYTKLNMQLRERDAREESNQLKAETSKGKSTVAPSATPPVDKSKLPNPTFMLTHNPTRKKYGPFEYAQGEPILIGKTAFTLSLKQLSQVENTLSKMRLPQIDMRSASLVNCIKFLELQTKHFAPKGEVVNFVVALPRSQGQQHGGDAFAASSGGRSRRGPYVTLELRDVSALAVLKMMMEQTGATFKIAGNTVTVYPKS